MELKLILAGIGGQGVIFATKVLAHAAVARGERVMVSENHGMSKRGGSVLAHVKIGASQSSLIRRATADALIAFDRAEALRALTFVRSGGSVYVNISNGLEPRVMARLAELGIGVHAVDADACSRALGAPATTNLVVLGFAAAHPGFGLSGDDLKAAARALGPARAVELNVRALELGASQA